MRWGVGVGEQALFWEINNLRTEVNGSHLHYISKQFQYSILSLACLVKAHLYIILVTSSGL